eukprot:s419_g39.t1
MCHQVAINLLAAWQAMNHSRDAHPSRLAGKQKDDSPAAYAADDASQATLSRLQCLHLETSAIGDAQGDGCSFQHHFIGADMAPGAWQIGIAFEKDGRMEKDRVRHSSMWMFVVLIAPIA